VKVKKDDDMTCPLQWRAAEAATNVGRFSCHQPPDAGCAERRTVADAAILAQLDLHDGCRVQRPIEKTAIYFVCDFLYCDFEFFPFSFLGLISIS